MSAAGAGGGPGRSRLSWRLPLRWRLALVYGLGCALALFASGLLSYAFHTRSHYDELDRVLVDRALHLAAEVRQAGTRVNTDLQAGGLPVLSGVYGPDGRVRRRSAAAPALVQASPPQVLAAPAGPAYAGVVALFPRLTPPPPHPAGGAFGLLVGEQRWRVFVLPVRAGGTALGYVETLTPLGLLDRSVARLRTVLLGVGTLCLLGALAATWFTAGRLLRPLEAMTAAAREIARSREPTARVAPPPHDDEVGELARTFNTMLESLEESAQTQRRFIADASHELRAPLTVVRANLDLLRRYPDMPEAERADVVREAERESERMTRLVGQLLTLARGDAGLGIRRGQVVLEALVRETVQEAQHLARGQRLALGPVDAATVEGDGDRLKQLLLILLDNAVHYTPPGGQVNVTLRRDGPAARLTVSDTGVGIAGPDLPRVFERFYRGAPARTHHPGGSGLGLPIARWIAEQHGGSLRLASRPGVGTQVTFELPVAPGTGPGGR
ncbi:hypothetical protein GCM10025871_39710 [Deinococcus metallilatus]|nr:hypothetical protein GCM10025871_39710 [Deinococcus metallilatus]